MTSKMSLSPASPSSSIRRALIASSAVGRFRAGIPRPYDTGPGTQAGSHELAVTVGPNLIESSPAIARVAAYRTARNFIRLARTDPGSSVTLTGLHRSAQCRAEPDWVELCRLFAHNPEVAGSNPAPATK